jgi:hypothetical protein
VGEEVITKCPKCGSDRLEIVNVLDVDDEDLGESLHCKKCHWLEEDEWPNVVK